MEHKLAQESNDQLSANENFARVRNEDGKEINSSMDSSWISIKTDFSL